MNLPASIHALIQSEHPDLLHWLSDMRQAFAGCEVSFVKIGEFERGDRGREGVRAVLRERK